MKKPRDYGPANSFIVTWKKGSPTRKFFCPWHVALGGIKNRTHGYSERDRRTYGGIKCLVDSKDLKELFFRDKAYLMRHPSIDRIDHDGHYEKSNIRWVELSENRKHRYMAARKEKYQEGKKLLLNFFESCKWPNHIRASFLNYFRRDCRISFR